MYLFLDTNTFLSFYLFSKDSLDELKKLAALIKEKEITLFLPSQVVDELYRNREAKICESLKRMKDQFPKPQIPRIAESYDEYDELIKLAASCEEIKLSLLKKIEDDVETKSLVADKLIDKIVKNSKIKPIVIRKR